MSLLFSPLSIKSVTFKNRFAVSPMCQYSSVDGFANDWHLVHLGSRAVGGAGLVMQEATAVTAEGRITLGDLGIWKDDHIDKLKNMVSFIHQHGAIAGVQLAHAGRKGSCQVPWDGGKQIKIKEGGWVTPAPSAIAYYPEDENPEALSTDGIKKVIEAFKAATRRAYAAGYKVIEIHAAHGYLIHEFLSPLSNHRTDNYGGSFENRTRLLLDVTKEIQTVWPSDLPLFVRISATDWADGGWNDTESTKLAHILKDLGVDLIDCSSGGLVPHQKITVGPGYQVPFSERIKKETGILTGAVGMITDADQAETILTENKADLISMAREELRNPYFPLIAAKELKEEIAWPVQYVRAKV